MKVKFGRWLGALFLTTLGSVSSWAAAGDTFTCSMTAPVYSPTAAYSPFDTVVNQTAVSFTVSCSRNFNGGATLNYRVSVNNGLNNGGNNPNKAVNTAATSNVPYDLYTTVGTGCVTLWEAPNYLTGAISWTGNDQTPKAATANTFNLCIPTGSRSVLADSHKDTLTFTITNSVTGTPTVTATPVQSIFTIGVNKECAFTTPLGASLILPNYTSFTSSPVSASMGFATRCTNQWPYTMSLEGAATGNNTSPINGVIAGLNYTLEIITPNAAVRGATVSVTGTGAPQSNSIKAVVPALQAGSCAGTACSSGDSVSHTLTFTY